MVAPEQMDEKQRNIKGEKKAQAGCTDDYAKLTTSYTVDRRDDCKRPESRTSEKLFPSRGCVLTIRMFTLDQY